MIDFPIAERVFAKLPSPLRDPCDHQPEHGQRQERFARLDLAFVILAQAPLPSDPGQRPFHDLAPRPDHKALGLGLARDDPQAPLAFSGTPPGQSIAAVGAVGPDQLQAGLQGCEP
jgi:hypothetical protein